MVKKSMLDQFWLFFYIVKTISPVFGIFREKNHSISTKIAPKRLFTTGGFSTQNRFPLVLSDFEIFLTLYIGQFKSGWLG
jgi:hypothetical protein